MAIAEDKRRRNTAASGTSHVMNERKICIWTDGTYVVYVARFRVKKKQWTLNLERSISDLSGRVEELEREAAELRRENGWLKEIVMLKSKRFGGPVPELNPESSQGSDSNSGGGEGPSPDKGSENDQGDDSTHSGTDKGKERAHS